MIICSITLGILIAILYKLNRMGYKIDLLWLNESQINNKILDELNRSNKK